MQAEPAAVHHSPAVEGLERQLQIRLVAFALLRVELPVQSEPVAAVLAQDLGTVEVRGIARIHLMEDLTPMREK